MLNMKFILLLPEAAKLISNIYLSENIRLYTNTSFWLRWDEFISISDANLFRPKN